MCLYLYFLVIKHSSHYSIFYWELQFVGCDGWDWILLVLLCLALLNLAVFIMDYFHVLFFMFKNSFPWWNNIQTEIMVNGRCDVHSFRWKDYLWRGCEMQNPSHESISGHAWINQTCKSHSGLPGKRSRGKLSEIWCTCMNPLLRYNEDETLEPLAYHFNRTCYISFPTSMSPQVGRRWNKQKNEKHCFLTFLMAD